MGAQNPSDDSTLIALAKSLGLDEQQFATDLNAPETQKQLESEMIMGRQLGAQGFPSMILAKDGQAQYLPLDYNNAENALNMIRSAI